MPKFGETLADNEDFTLLAKKETRLLRKLLNGQIITSHISI